MAIREGQGRGRAMSEKITHAAIVTGSATGIGRAIALGLSRLGWGVVLNYTTSAEAMAETEALCRESGGDPVVVRGDVAEDTVCRELVRVAAAEWDRLDGLVSNAGVTKFVVPGDLEGLDRADFERIFSVNLVACWQLVRASADLMRRSGGGSIVTMSSLSAFTGAGSSAAYSSSKAALNTLTLSLARALAPEIRVNALCPGYVDTRWSRRGIGDEHYETFRMRLAEKLPLKRMVVADDVAEAAIWFLTAAGAITGQTLVVDAGEHLAGGLEVTTDS